jgi:hypothetical protein
VAHAAHLLTAHHNQAVCLEMDNGVPSANAQPSWGIGPALTAHARMAHAGALQAEVADLAFGGLDGQMAVTLSRTGFKGMPYFTLRGHLRGSNLQTQGNVEGEDGTAWMEIAQRVGLFCEAAAGTTPFHQAMLWTLVGVSQESRPFTNFHGWVAQAAKGVLNSKRSSTLFGLQLPALAYEGAEEALAKWLHAAIAVARDAARGAFEGERTLLEAQAPTGQAQQAREPKGKGGVVTVLV